MITALYFGFYGVALLWDAVKCFGAKGFLPYFHTSIGAVGTFYTRGFATLCLTMAFGYFLNAGSALLSKMNAFALVMLMP